MGEGRKGGREEGSREGKKDKKRGIRRREKSRMRLICRLRVGFLLSLSSWSQSVYKANFDWQYS